MRARKGMQVNKAGELSLKCDCTLQCNSSDVGDAVALVDCWIFNSGRSVFRARLRASCEFWCQWMKCVWEWDSFSFFSSRPLPNPQPKFSHRCHCLCWRQQYKIHNNVNKLFEKKKGLPIIKTECTKKKNNTSRSVLIEMVLNISFRYKK